MLSVKSVAICNPPGKSHWTAVKQILRYLKETIDHGVVLGGNSELKLQGFTDADWASDVDSPSLVYLE